ncbi:MAG: class I SAM-dependent methyltransferase [Bacilli bacterium]|nr:class I SAM-dependent methyltransferase [Bacilli bacterium]
MAHYFEYDKDLKSREIEKKVDINGTKLKFITDYGVFSKKGLDFGTRTLLDSLNLENIKGSILDFGCGYGPIGIYIKKTTNASVTMLDINKRSVDLARKNAELNNVDVNVIESNMYENIDDKFDFIISNPPIRVGKKILYEILFGAKDYLKENGQLWIVINKDQGAKSVAKDLETEYKVEIVNKNKGFYIICASMH